MRKEMTKEVTHTTVTLGKMEMIDGEVKAEKLDPITLLGNVSQEKAQREINKRFPGQSVQVLGVQANTKHYKMSVERFIELADEVTENE